MKETQVVDSRLSAVREAGFFIFLFFFILKQNHYYHLFLRILQSTNQVTG